MLKASIRTIRRMGHMFPISIVGKTETQLRKNLEHSFSGPAVGLIG